MNCKYRIARYLPEIDGSNWTEVIRDSFIQAAPSLIYNRENKSPTAVHQPVRYVMHYDNDNSNSYTNGCSIISLNCIAA
jgi:hypothetical protein